MVGLVAQLQRLARFGKENRKKTTVEMWTLPVAFQRCSPFLLSPEGRKSGRSRPTAHRADQAGRPRASAGRRHRGTLQYKPVVTGTVNPMGRIMKIDLDGESISCTPGHPMWAVGGGWRLARQLEVGERLHTLSGGDRENNRERGIRRMDRGNTLTISSWPIQHLSSSARREFWSTTTRRASRLRPCCRASSGPTIRLGSIQPRQRKRKRISARLRLQL